MGFIASELRSNMRPGRRAAKADTACAMSKLFPAGGRAGDVAVRGAVRRVRLHQGIPGREVLPRREDRDHLRRHEQHAAENDCEAAPEVTAVTPWAHRER